MTAPLTLAESSERSLTKRSFTGTTVPEELLEPDERDLLRANILLTLNARANATPLPADRISWNTKVASPTTQRTFDAIYTFEQRVKPHQLMAIAVKLHWGLDSDNGKTATAEQVFDVIQALYLSGVPRDRQIAERLTTLYRDALAEDEVILPESLGQFRDFFLNHSDFGLPKITLTPDGMLRARWIHGPGNFAAIEFTGHPLVKLVAEVPRGSVTARHFSSEAVENVVSTACAMGASFA